LPVGLALEQTDGNISHFTSEILPDSHPQAVGNFTYLERIFKDFCSGRVAVFRIHFEGPPALATKLAAYYRDTATGRFDSNIVAERMFDSSARSRSYARTSYRTQTGPRPLGRHLEGCRIGFDPRWAATRKAAAVIDGKIVFSEETVWDPYFQTDPQYHFDGIMDSLKKAAAHLPRIDAIGGSAAGIYLNNRVKVSSIFRGVPPDVFQWPG